MAEFYWRTDLFKFQMFLPIPGVPLLREGYLLAFLTCTGLRFGPSPKTKSSETFADQAVIAIENTQLFEAEQQRTRELAESLEQQTATSARRRPAELSRFSYHTMADARCVDRGRRKPRPGTDF